MRGRQLSKCVVHVNSRVAPMFLSLLQLKDTLSWKNLDGGGFENDCKCKNDNVSKACDSVEISVGVWASSPNSHLAMYFDNTNIAVFSTEKCGKLHKHLYSVI